jgi:hypothetical protein
LVLLLLAVLWAAVLGPAFLRNRVEGRSSDSIGAFRRQLGVLQRTGPSIVSPANTLGSSPAPIGTRVAINSAGPGRAAGHPRLSSPHRQRTLQRRRDVLVVLGSSFLGSLLVGAIPAFRPMWFVGAAIGVVLLAYVGLLLRLRNLASEREMKLTYLPRPNPAETALLLRRSVN